MARPVLLICGVLSSVLYVATDLAGAWRWDGYSYTAQTVSELSAIGAPSRPLVAPLFFLYGVLVIAFGLGVRASADRRPVRVIAALLIVYGVACLTGPFTPMHLRGTETSLTDTLHIIGAIVDSSLLMLIIGTGAVAFTGRFRHYSIATIVVVLGFGALAGLDGPRIPADLPTPWVGVTERTCIFAALLWIAVLAITLWRVTAMRSRPADRRDPRGVAA